MPTPASIAALGEPSRTGLALDRGSRPRPGGRARKGCSSGWTCRRRSRRAARAPRPRAGRTDVVVGDDPREPLRDVPHLEDLRTAPPCRGIIYGPRNRHLGRRARPAQQTSARMSISPSAICAETASSSAHRARSPIGRVGADLAVADTVVRRRRRACPRHPRSSRPRLRWIVSKTATSTFLVALVSMCGPRNAWSLSTPMPHTFCSFAAWSAPSPQPPAACEDGLRASSIWVSASSLHFAWATKSCE